MKKKSLGSLIELFALLGGWCLIVGIASPWFMIGAFVFGGAAAVTKLFDNVVEE